MMQNTTSIPLPSQPGQPAVLLYCRPCLEVQLMSPYDSAPLYREQGDDFEEEPDQGRNIFLQRHSGHSLTTLKKKKDKFSADRPVWDPFRTAYEEVTDGRETFLLKSWRTDISAPRQYTLLRGSLDIATTVTLPEEPLRSSLAGCFPSFTPLLPGLMKALQRTVSMLPSDEFIPAYCSADDPQVSFSYLAEHHLRMLVRCCYEVGLSLEKDRLWHFFTTRQQEEELTVEMRQHCHPCFS
ncbi:MAG TPA: hypothetical protein VKK81_28885 [Candidatus Binatia bacterium]|nr:hypothetical protein [Candidatus Binatia bacterium]